MAIVPTYTIESELRELAKDPAKNGNRIYSLVKIVAGRIIYKNPSKIGNDVDHRQLAHEIAAEITTRLIRGSLAPINHWSGYIKCVLPRFVKANAATNGSQIIDAYKLGIDPKKIIECSHAGSLNLMINTSNHILKSELEEIDKVIDDWLQNNIRYIDRYSSIYDNLKISIKLTAISDKTIVFRLDDSYTNLIIVYSNKLKIYLARLLLSNQSDNPYDQILEISNYDSLEEIHSFDD